MFIAHFDESGNFSDTDAFCLASIVATEKQWNQFHIKWRRRLRRDGIKQFHMSDLLSGELVTLDEYKKTALLTDLGAILINAAKSITIHCVAKSDWYEMIDPLFSKYEKPRAPYILLLQGCLLWFETKVKIPVNERLACVCEENKLVAHAAKDFYERMKRAYGLEKIFGSITFAPKDDCRSPLEAADMAAHLGFRFVKGLLKKRHDNVRKHLTALMNSQKVHLCYYDRSKLAKFRDAIGEVRAGHRLS